MEIKVCPATHVSDTAAGPAVVRCTKPADHVERGDLQHMGKLGAFPVRCVERSHDGPTA